MEEGPPTKRGRVTSPAHAAGGDWLSALPDDVILRIMSFMDTRQAVQTCVLARQWRNLWRSVPRINADIGKFDEEDEAAFKRFLDRLLELRNPTAPIDTFCLTFCRSDGDDAGSEDGNNWISHALQKKAQIVEVVVQLYALELDDSMFTSHFLRRIEFSNVLMDQGFFEQLDAGCPALEDLILDDCIIVDDEVYSKTLKVLTIVDTQFSKEHRTYISSPSVTDLTLWSPLDAIPVLKEMALIMTASVAFHVGDNDFGASDLRQYLWSLSGVKILDFEYWGRKLTIENNLQWCPKFINLVSLTLSQWCLDANFYGLVVFLQNSPRLEKLTLNLTKSREGTPERIVGELKERSFTCEHLTSIEVICSEDDPLVVSVEDFFVNSGMTSLQIHIKHEDE